LLQEIFFLLLRISVLYILNKRNVQVATKNKLLTIRLLKFAFRIVFCLKKNSFEINQNNNKNKYCQNYNDQKEIERNLNSERKKQRQI